MCDSVLGSVLIVMQILHLLQLEEEDNLILHGDVGRGWLDHPLNH